MKKLILIFSLLLSSINVSADLGMEKRIADNDDFLIGSSYAEYRQDQAQESFDTYETFLEFNAQQEQNDPTGGNSRVSDTLMRDAKTMAVYDLVAYAVSSTFQGILTRNPDADYNYEVTSSDIEEGINASREIIGSFRDNPVFSVVDQLTMAASVNYYFNEGFNSNELTAGSNAMSEVAFSALLTRGNNLYAQVFRRQLNLDAANRFATSISTFFTNQNAVQSTCLNASCASPAGPM